LVIQNIIERIKLSASLNNQPRQVISMLKSIHGGNLSKTAFGDYKSYDKLREFDSTLLK
jgi:hypothetical protein